jgi:hypothetical protein
MRLERLSKGGTFFSVCLNSKKREYVVEQESENEWYFFADYINMFLKLKRESSGCPAWEQSEDDKGRYKEYLQAEGIFPDKTFFAKECRTKNFGKTEIEFCVA